MRCPTVQLVDKLVDTRGRVCVPSAPRLYVPSPLEAEWLRHAEWMETNKALEPFGFMGRARHVLI